MYVSEKMVNKIKKMIKNRERRIERHQREVEIINFYSLAKKYGFLLNYQIPSSYIIEENDDEYVDEQNFNVFETVEDLL